LNLAQVGGSAFALGQQLAGASLPVVLTAAQITTLTPPTSITANAGTNLNTSALATSANQATNSATTTHTCNPAGFSELGCLGQIDDDVKSGAGSTGSAVPSTAVYFGGSSGGNLVGIVTCGSHTYQHITSNTDTLLVQGVASQTVKICGVTYNFAGAAAQNVYLENTASANANCSSTKTQIGPLITGPTTGPSTVGFYNSTWGGMANTSGDGLCVNSSASGGVDVEVWYTQGS
jgi:hypothetical protein